MKKLAFSLVRFCMTSQPTATPVHGYLFSQMFVMAVDYHCEAVVCDGSSFQRAHKLQGEKTVCQTSTSLGPKQHLVITVTHLCRTTTPEIFGSYCTSLIAREYLRNVENENRTCRACKTTVSHFEICKFVPKLPNIPNS